MRSCTVGSIIRSLTIKQKNRNMKTLLVGGASVVMWLVALWAFLGMLWLLLMFGCTQDHSVKECRDNIMTEVVTYPVKGIIK